MKLIAISLLIYAVTTIDADVTKCPSYCTCQLEGASGVRAFCTRLDPNEQHFSDPIQHLTIMNENSTQLSLSDYIFQKLGLTSLESIKIVNSSLSDISVKAFQGLPSLFDVNLSDNQLYLIHVDTFANNTNLHRLKLSGNALQLTQLLKTSHEYLLRSSSLTDFDLSNCQLSQIAPKTFSQLKNLVFINLSSNYLKSIPKDVFEGLDSLEDLDLSNNLISRVDQKAFKLNKNLSVLRLRKNPIEILNGIMLPDLEELHLSECKLRILMRENIEGMPQLNLLNLRSNRIEVLSDDSFVDLTELKQLDLSNNKLIGPMAGDLFKNNRRLESLSLSGNKELGMLVEETGFIDNHLAMTKLEIADCGLTNLTAGQLRGMDNLNILNVSHNYIKTLDSVTFAKLKSLNYLDLSYNKLETLPVSLFAMNTDLVKLWLAGNPLKQLPLYLFSYVNNLKFLDVSNCGLQQLWDQHKHQPDGHKILGNLAFLDMSRNNITELHIWDFHSMDHLETIDLSDNPIHCISPFIQLIEWFIKKEVDPHHQLEKIQQNGKEEKLKWDDIILSICPKPIIDRTQTTPRIEKVIHTEPNVIPLLDTARNTFTRVDEIVVEDSSSINSSIMWPTILAASILIVALYLIIYLVGEITHRRRALAATYARPGSLGGHVRTRGVSGSPLYYKLYEECSIPAQPVKTKKDYVLDFSPIHTILKKGTYKIMKTNEVNV